MDPTPMQLDVAGWANSDPIDIADLRGRVVMVEAFQMLCPGCVSHGIPQALRVHRAFHPGELTVIGLHTVFEHHAVMTPEALNVFLSEYRIGFPVAIDRPVEGRSLPATMAAYGLQGTPSTLLLDKAGRVRHLFLGALDDLHLGVHIGRLLSEPAPDDEVPEAVPVPRLTVAPGVSTGDVCAPGEPCS